MSAKAIHGRKSDLISVGEKKNQNEKKIIHII